ncbi:LOW QUALITY PROTEIN: E3 ubiquitin-protein ligase MGRN1-like [Pollicipes pollicipes]|uniref:LOW QUALITY PROTEIN: E3 ubiquitin-protein ligase MGRN1-like n=1 Tax=Pollicipes pollicipes TaxID=41117 RepID=UPI0018859B2C|nr:LOW QUALITY PROTEIN: E3 ubiquitin-protein ligase MGRN1-like [Pollicipes pollicipes]
MGSLASRQEGTTEELDPEHVHSYKYPPKSGNYFGTHFIMGGDKFETPQPEAYLFGENSDLNFLSSKPAPCPYALSAPNEPSKTLKSVINIRKDSLRLVRYTPEGGASADGSPNQQLFNIEFTFDCDVRCSITIHYFCSEEVTRNGLMYRPRDASMSSETYRYKCGAAQTFSQRQHLLEPALYTDAELAYNPDVELYPVVVVCQAEEGDDPRQCHVTTGYVDRMSDGSYMLKPLKQKQYIDGLVFLLQEIYGIENKLVDNKSVDDDTEDSGAECVICMSDLRDTLILPCRHLCVCNCCADHLRYQANNCPICRAPFRALLQLRAVQRVPPGGQPPLEGVDGVPPGYEPVALVEALNGPIAAPRDASSPVTSRNASGTVRPRPSLKRNPSAVSERGASRDGLPPVTTVRATVCSTVCATACTTVCATVCSTLCGTVCATVCSTVCDTVYSTASLRSVVLSTCQVALGLAWLYVAYGRYQLQRRELLTSSVAVEPVAFPAITVCPELQLNYYRVVSLNNGTGWPRDLWRLYRPARDGSAADFLLGLSARVEQLVEHCFGAGCDHWRPLLTREGVCYTLVPPAGGAHGKQVELRLSLYRYVRGLVWPGWSNYRVFVHGTERPVVLQDGFLSLNAWVLVDVGDMSMHPAVLVSVRRTVTSNIRRRPCREQPDYQQTLCLQQCLRY